MAARLDHLVYATPDLPATSAQISQDWGVTLTPGGAHVGMGTRNELRSLGNGSYFELIGPDPDQAIEPAIFDVASITRPRLVAFAAGVDDIDAAIGAFRSAGHDPGDPIAMERHTPAGERLAWRLTPPTTLPEHGTIPFLIDWGQTPHPSATLPGGLTLVSFTVRHPEPRRLETFYSVIGLEVPITEGPAGLAARIATPVGIIDL